jgi:hypothetical protein
MLNSILRKTQRLTSLISQIPSELAYRIELVKYANKLPKLAACDQSIVEACKKEGVFVTSLEDLRFTSTPQLLRAAKSQLNCMETVHSLNPVNQGREWQPNSTSFSSNFHSY